MKEICIDARLVNESGLGSYLKGLLPALSSAFHLILLHQKKDKAFLETLCKSTLIEMQSPIYSLQEQIELFRVIPKVPLFWSPHFNIPLLPIKAKKRLVTIHDMFHLRFFSTLSLKQKIYAKLVLNAAFLLSDHVVTDSEFSKQEILQLATFKPSKLDAILLGISSLFAPCLNEEKKKRLDLPEKYFLAVGNLKPHKNLKRLIAAFARFEGKEHLVIVGKKFDEEFVLSQELEKKVHFRGVLLDEDLPTLYTHASALLFPSLYEGFGLPPLEAMACGCPVMASIAGSIPEVCKDAAHYVDPYDVGSIAKGLCQVLERFELKEKGLKHVLNYPISRAVSKHVEIINSLI